MYYHVTVYRYDGLNFLKGSCVVCGAGSVYDVLTKNHFRLSNYVSAMEKLESGNIHFVFINGVNVDGRGILVKVEPWRTWYGLLSDEFEWERCEKIPKPMTRHNSMFDAVERVIFNDPATIVFWDDGSKTTVKCMKGDIYSPETGLAMCICKKVLGDDYHRLFRTFVPKSYEPSIDAANAFRDFAVTDGDAEFQNMIDQLWEFYRKKLNDEDYKKFMEGEK